MDRRYKSSSVSRPSKLFPLFSPFFLLEIRSAFYYSNPVLIVLIRENLTPPDLKHCVTHSPVFATFGEPTLCVVCDRLLRGTFYQGYRCSACGQAVHKECIATFKDCGKPIVRPRTGHRPSSGNYNGEKFRRLAFL